MSSNATLARPYARAAFELAHAGGALADWTAQLEAAASLAADERVAKVLANPRRTQDEAVELLLPAGAAADGPFAGFLRELSIHGRLPVLPEIAAQFEVLRRDAEGTLKVIVRSAVTIDATQLAALKASLARRFQRSIEITTLIDAALIGGAVIEAGETVIDGSVRGRLARLAQELSA